MLSEILSLELPVVHPLIMVAILKNAKKLIIMTQVKFFNRPVARQFDNFFSDFFTPAVWSNPSSDVTNIPAANVHETDAAYVLEISAPGRNKENFQVNIDKDLLTVSYENKEENVTEDNKTVRREFHFN